MWVVKPQPIELSYTNIQDSTAPEYNPATTYAIDAEVKVTIANQPTHTYKSLIAGTVGAPPATSPGSWEDLGVTNRWAMFDSTVSTQTTSDGDIVVEFGAESVDTLVFVGVIADAIRIEQRYGGDVVADQTYAMAVFDTDKIVDWYSYFFTCITFKSVLVATVVPLPYSTFRVTITTLSGVAACGVLSVGTKTIIGDSQWGIQLGFTDFSKFEFDEFGRPFYSQGAWANRATGSCVLDNSTINAIASLRASLRGAAAMYNLDDRDDGFEPLLLFGLFKIFDIVIPGPVESLVNYDIQGLT